jgi:hypothetical protein
LLFWVDLLVIKTFLFQKQVDKSWNMKNSANSQGKLDWNVNKNWLNPVEGFRVWEAFRI